MTETSNDERELFEFAVVNRERITRNADELGRLERRVGPLEHHAAAVHALAQRVEAVDAHVTTLSTQLALVAEHAVPRPSVLAINGWLTLATRVWAVAATTLLATH